MAGKKDNETPEERFKRVAEARANTVLEKLRLLGNCSSRRIYSYTEEDVNKIFSVLNKQIKEIRARFNSKKLEKIKL